MKSFYVFTWTGASNANKYSGSVAKCALKIWQVYICNKSIITGIFPTQLKYSTVKPLFKKGNNANITIIDQSIY
jgi:hypothetical protein